MQDETPTPQKSSANKVNFLKKKMTRRHGDSFVAWAVVAAGR
jgi:hypothetical protein